MKNPELSTKLVAKAADLDDHVLPAREPEGQKRRGDDSKLVALYLYNLAGILRDLAAQGVHAEGRDAAGLADAPDGALTIYKLPGVAIIVKFAQGRRAALEGGCRWQCRRWSRAC